MLPHLLAASVAMAGVEPAGFLWPEAEDVRIQKIARVAGEKHWPFVAQSGQLACLESWGMEMVYFLPDGDHGYERAFLLDTDMFQMTTVNYGMDDVLVPMQKASEIVERIRPYVDQGKMLCKYNDGPVVPGSEL